MIGQRLISIAKAISEHEGWLPPAMRNGKMDEGSVAYRNNNPGNLRSSSFEMGVKNGFSYFYNEEVGKMALYYDLWKKCMGLTITGLTPKSTLADLIGKYAPPSENDTETYIKTVEAKTGINRKTLLQDILKA